MAFNEERAIEIENILAQLDVLIERSRAVLEDTPEELRVGVPKNADEWLTANRSKLTSVREVTSRRHLKTVFFGRTSSGKSSTVNALLDDNVLPTGLGHTTSCFVEVRGTSRAEPRLVVPSEDGVEGALEIVKLSSINDIVHALSSRSLGPDSCVQLFWPRHRCPLLADDVVLVDTPGVDIDADFDVWIDRFCLDADLFVWVMNGESTPMRREKAFFEQVAKKLARPNILAVVNRWDCTSEEEEYAIHAAHSQHVERVSEFLVGQLKAATSRNEVERERIFFVSSREITADAKRDNTSAPPTPQSSRLTTERRKEWDRFSKTISANVSHSLHGARYLPFLDASLRICAELTRLNHGLIASCIEKHRRDEERRAEIAATLLTLERGMAHLTRELKIEIQTLLDAVGPNVEAAVREEAEKMADVVEDFEAAFYDDPVIRDVYMEQLTSYVDTILKRNLNTKLSVRVCNRVECAQTEIISLVSALLPECKRDFVDITPRRMPLDLDAAIERAFARRIVAEFREDVRFHFSLRPSRLARAYRKARKFFAYSPSHSERSREDQWRRWAWIMNASIAGSEASVAGTLIALGAVYRSVSWKVLLTIGLAYSSAYVVERLMWTSKAKEEAAKKQFVDFSVRLLGGGGGTLPAEKSSLFIACLTDLCREQAQKELHSTLVLACGAAEGAGREIKSEKLRLESDNKCLGSAMRRANDVIESANDVEAKLRAARKTLARSD